MNSQQARIESMHNQILVLLDGMLPEILAIEESLGADNRTDAVTKMCLCFIGGMLLKRRGDASLLESPH